MRRKNKYRDLQLDALAHKEICPKCKERKNTYICALGNKYTYGCHGCKIEWEKSSQGKIINIGEIK
jgi:hypothetical protein